MTGPASRKPVADCHVHVFDPARFPYRQGVARTPGAHETAPVELLMAVLDSSGVSHALLVTPTAGYGGDNSSVVDALARYPDRLRGIAVVEADVTDGELAGLKSMGFAGVRVDLLSRDADYLSTNGAKLPARLRDMEMVLQIQTAGALLDTVGDRLIAEAGVVVIDHMGRPNPALGMDQPGFRTLLRMAESSSVAVKLSGPFRFSSTSFPYAEADLFAKAVFDTFGADRCVWGSDWPFVAMDNRLDYGPCFEALSRWVPAEVDRRRILWDTPRRLFGFTEA